MANPVKQLIAVALERMRNSHDPMHDIEHTKRVVKHVRQIASTMNLNKDQYEALILAAWWHDVSRTLTKNPSFVWMPMIDDTLSALMLWRETIRYGLFGSVAGMATRLIVCKSFGTGAILSRILMRKKNRVMIHILIDADMLDTLTIERIKHMQPLVESSRLYRTGYRILIRWFIRHMHARTQAAQATFSVQFQTFIAWAQEESTVEWHRQQFGATWVEKRLIKGEGILERLTK